MRTRLTSLLSLCVVLVALLVLPKGQASAAPLPDTTSNFHLNQVFDYNMSASQISSVGKRYDFVWGAEPSNLSAWRSANSHVYLTYYIPFHRDYGSYTDHTAKTLSWYKSNHPDWVLYKCDKSTPAYEYGDPYIPLDLTNQAVVNWQVATYGQPAANAGYDGIAADNVNLENISGACGHFSTSGQWVSQFSGNSVDTKYADAVVTWLALMRSGLHALSHPLGLVPNFSADGFSFSDSHVSQSLAQVDQILDEEGFSAWGNGFTTGSAWTGRQGLIEQAQSQGKAYHMVNQFSTVTNADIAYASASYLMTKEQAATLCVTGEQGYGSPMPQKGLTAKVGSPTGAMTVSQNVYVRHYSNGLALANPSSSATYTYTIGSGHSYKDQFGNTIGTSVTLKPHTGKVLIGS